jgi:hypothetical protein
MEGSIMQQVTHKTIRDRVIERSFQDRAVIEQLRSSADLRQTQEASRPGVNDVAIIVDDLIKVVPISITAAKMPRATEAEQVKMVLDVVATFGTWLTHSQGPSLMQSLNQIQIAYIPSGYEPTAPHRRDVTKALTAIVLSKPNHDVIARFVSRTYRSRSGSLTYALVAGVWMFAQCGRLHKVDRVSNDSVFHKLVVSAYDLLDVARLDAIAGIEFLASKPNAEKDVKEIIHACVKSRWLAERRIGRLEKVARNGNTSDLQDEIKAFNRHILSDFEAFHPSSIASLNAGHVLRICVAAGLKVEDDTRPDEASIRTRLRSMGLSIDADRLVPEALRAVQRNQSDEFWAIMQSRLDGDITWADQLEELA